MRWPPSYRGAVAALVVAALVVRVAAVAVDGGYVPRQDAGDYHRHAASLAAGDGFAPSQYVPAGGPSALRAPGYPLALGAVYAVTGDRPAAGRLLNALLGALTVLAVISLTRRIWGPAPALAAGALTALHPPLVGMSLELFSENLFVPLLLAAALAVLRARETAELRWAAAAGALTGLAALTRGPGLVTLAPVALGLWALRPRLSWRAMAAPALGVACAVLVIAPWTVRNLAEFGRVIPVVTATGYGLAGTYNPVSRDDHARWRSALEVPALAPLFADRSLDEGDLDAALRSAARTFAADHPAYALEVVARNLPRLFYVGDDSVVGRGEVTVEPGIGNRGTALEKAGLAIAVLLAAAGVGAIATARRRRRRDGTMPAMLPPGPAYLWLIPLALLATAAATAGLPRYRVIADPFLLMLAGIGLVALLRRRARPALALVAALALTGCGSGGDDAAPAARPTPDADAVATWVERAEPVCERANRAAERLGERFRASDISDLRKAIDDLLVRPAIRLRDRQARQLRGLGPLPEHAEDLQTFVGLFDPIAELIRLRLAAGRDGDRRSADGYEELGLSLATEQRRAAEAAGMRACAVDVSRAAFG